MAHLHCVTCQGTLPEGQEHPDYFGQEAGGWQQPGLEVERAAGDLIRCLEYTKQVASAMWTLMQSTDMGPAQIEAVDYLGGAHALRALLADLVAETNRRAGAFSNLVEQKYATAAGLAEKEF